MRTYITRSLAAMGAVFAMTVAGPALASPIHVSIGAPALVATTPALALNIGRPACPGPNYVWVQGTMRHDAWGRQHWVAGHWRHVAPVSRAVVVHRAKPVVRHHGHSRSRVVVRR